MPTLEQRLVQLGCDEEQIDKLVEEAEKYDWYKVEALVLVRGCPFDLALRIASYE